MEHKVYLRIETPFSLKNPLTMRMVLMSVGTTAGMLAVTVMQFAIGSDIAVRFAAVCAAWLLLGMIPTALLLFCSYACVEGEELVCVNMGFLRKRYARSRLQKATVESGKVVLYSGAKPVASMPLSPQAKALVEALRVPHSWN